MAKTKSASNGFEKTGSASKSDNLFDDDFKMSKSKEDSHKGSKNEDSKGKKK